MEKPLKALVEKEMKDVKYNLHKYIESALLSIVGLERRGSDVEIDHCNGRASLLIETFTELAKEEASKIAKNYKFDKDELGAFKNAFKREVNSQMGYALRDLAREYIRQLIKAEFENTKLQIEKEIKSQLKQEISKVI